MAQPEVSILMTARDVDPWIGEAIESVLAQEDCPPFELVLVDDGSRDGTRAAMLAAAAADPRVRTVLFDPPGQGRGKALQAAHAVAKGALVGWVDADDVLEPRALAVTSDAMARDPEAGFCYTRHWLMSSDGKRLAPGRTSDGEYSLEQLRRGHIAHHFRLMRASAIEAVGGVSDWPVAVDYELALRLAEAAPVVQIAERLYRWRQRTGSVTRARRREQQAFSRLAIQESKARGASRGQAKAETP